MQAIRSLAVIHITIRFWENVFKLKTNVKCQTHVAYTKNARLMKCQVQVVAMENVFRKNFISKDVAVLEKTDLSGYTSKIRVQSASEVSEAGIFF